MTTTPESHASRSILPATSFRIAADCPRLLIDRSERIASNLQDRIVPGGWFEWSVLRQVLLVLWLSFTPGLANAFEHPALKILVDRCAECHGEKFSGNPTMSFAKLNTLNDPAILVPGDAEKSLIYTKVRDGEMPEDGELTDAEKNAIKEWIDLGAPGVLTQGESSPRKKVTLEEIEIWIRNDLQNEPIDDRRYMRYVSLVALANDARISVSEVVSAKVAVSKVANSLSSMSVVTRPVEIGDAGLVLRLDIRDYGWSQSQWSDLEINYPYGLRSVSRSESDPLVSVDQLTQQMQTKHLFLRGDWLVDTIPRPEHYYKFLCLPLSVQELEAQIGVDAAKNLKEGMAQQAGFATSKVSIGNRLLQRHASRNGSYWKSFDFGEEKVTGNIFRRPFSQATLASEKPFVLAFDGGEMIYSLPNGLQGYYLSDSVGRRLERGPISVVRDERQTGGTAEVVNAISCMSCHASGMIDFQDTVRAGHVLSGEMSRRVKQLYPEEKVLKQLVDQDRDRFLNAMKQVVGDWGDLTEYRTAATEPIGKLARNYQQDIDLETAASEIGVQAETLQNEILRNDQLVRMGLKPLTQGNKIKRGAWSDRSAFLSPMQSVAKELRLGIPSN